MHQNFVSFGVRFQVIAHDPQLRDSLPYFLPFGSRPCPSQVEPPYTYCFEQSAESYSLYADGQVLVRGGHLSQVLEAFESSAQLYIAEHSPHGIFVHAGVVGWENRALLFPGRSFSGKSTLVAALLDAGATYYSDEYAILKANGRVLPYPRAISLRQENGTSRKVQTTELDAQIGQASLSVGAIIVCRYKAGARWQPQTLSPGQALLALLDNTVAARSRTDAALPALKKAVANAPCFQGTRGEAEEFAAEILQQVSDL